MTASAGPPVCDAPVCDGPVCVDLDRRRQDVLADCTPEGNALNGVEDVEVASGPTACTLLVHCLRPVPTGLRVTDVLVEPDGPAPRRAVTVLWAFPASDLAAAVTAGLLADADLASLGALPSDVLVVQTTGGDAGPYRFAVAHPVARGFDPRLSCARFSFVVDPDSDLDCAPRRPVPLARAPEPVLDYLNRDYTGLRGMLLDRLSVQAPAWTDRNPADVGVMLVELFAYLGDHLAAAQDAVAAEAYLGTARQRVSVGRHTRLLDYRMHQGVAARAWLVLTANDDADAAAVAGERRQRCDPDRADDAYFSLPGGIRVRSTDGTVEFHTLYGVTPRKARNAIDVYAWGGRRCVLPKGTTRAFLVGTLGELGLQVGDVLVLEEVGPDGTAASADVEHRWPVRLSTAPCAAVDPLTGTHLVEVRWYDDDALPFALDLRRFPGRPCAGDTGAAVARGNVVLAEHGALVPEDEQADEDLVPSVVPPRGRYRPALARPGLAHVQPYFDADARSRPAAEALVVDPRAAVADILRLADQHDEVWTVRPDLLGSDRFATHVVVEMTDDGLARLRFGDNVRGRRPASDLRFRARYRLGGGSAGNVGRDVLTVLVEPLLGVSVGNPLPAAGGAEPERVEQVRQFAPQAFRVQERAVTDEDYAEVTQRDPQIQRAVATRRWTGSWYTEFVTVDRRRGAAVDPLFRKGLTRRLDRFRMAGSDVEVAGPVLVALDVALTVCVAPGHLQGAVTEALLDRLSARDLPGGMRGFFHPDELTFAQPVYLSAVVAAAMAVAGVAWVQPTRFQRLGLPAAGELAAGVIRMDRLEVASCDSDPARPDRGRIDFDVIGGF